MLRGEQKSLQTDRVILVPGPEPELKIVHQIYTWFVVDRQTESEIAGQLNAMGINTDLDRLWTRSIVHEILTNEKYIGNNIYNRRSYKLKKLRIVNQPSMWIKKLGAFAPIVPEDIFGAAQTIIRARSFHYSNEDLMSRLRGLLLDRGHLSGLIIDEAEHMPSSSVYAHRFGSLVRAYQAIGYTPSRDYQYVEVNRLLRDMHPEIVRQTEVEVGKVGGVIKRDPLSDLLVVNGEFTVSIVLARCHTRETGRRYWKVRFDSGLRPDLTVAVRLNPTNNAVQDYYLLPRLDFGQSGIHLAEHNSFELESYRFDDLDYLYGMTERAHLRRAA